MFGHAFFQFPLAGKISRIQNFKKFPDSCENFVVDPLYYGWQPQTAVDKYIDFLRFFLQSRSADRLFMICISIEMGKNILRLFEFYCSIPVISVSPHYDSANQLRHWGFIDIQRHAMHAVQLQCSSLYYRSVLS